MPNDLGGGVGHVRRTIQLAQLLREDGWQTGFVFYSRKTAAFLSGFSDCFRISVLHDSLYTLARSKVSPIHFYPVRRLEEKPYFWEFASLNYQVLRDGYFHRSIIARRLKKIARIISKWKPDVLIGDGHLLAYFVGKIRSIPTIQIVRYFVFPESPNFVWWKEVSSDLIRPHTKPMFADLFEEYGLEAAEEASHYLTGDAYLIPGTHEIEPILTDSPHMFYGYPFDKDDSDAFVSRRNQSNTPQIFVTIGGGAHRTRLDLLYESIYSALIKSSYRVIISDPLDLLAGKPLREGMKVQRWINSSAIYPNTDLVIHHGGYATTLESLRWGIPAVIIPSHSEQEGNGRRIESLNAGKILLGAELPYESVDFLFHSGEFNMLGGFRFSLTGDLILSIIEQTLRDANLKDSAVRQSESLRTAYNSEEIVEFVREVSKF